jgi:hypothetical protein
MAHLAGGGVIIASLLTRLAPAPRDRHQAIAADVW